MQRFLYQALLLLGLLFFIPSAQARDAMHTDSAFLFADRADWQNALAHARKSGDGTLKKVITWLYLQDAQSGASFGDIADFMRENPDWPHLKRLQLRAESAIRLSNVSDKALEKWFREYPPISGAGMVAQAEQMLRSGAQASSVAALLREAWHKGDFDAGEEQRLLATHGTIFSARDHEQRTDRLLWEEKISSAQRMLSLLTPTERTLARARITLLTGDKEANFLLTQLSRAQLKDPGLIYARMQWRAERDDDAGVREMLLAAPQELPYPEKWWRQRELQVRKAIDERNYKQAARLLAHHGLSDGAEGADALWLMGWLQLEFLHQPQEAYGEFYKMFDMVRFPVSKARAAYWAARASEKASDKPAAESWYTTASAYPSTFYGQMAAHALHGSAPLGLPAEPAVSQEERNALAKSELARVMLLLLSKGKDDLGTVFINHLIDGAKSPERIAAITALVREAQGSAPGVRAAKRALQQNVLLLEAGYPRPQLGDLALERPLALAISRQESEFDASAESRAGALGLMQLLPATAKEVARKNDIPYNPRRLLEPSYNAALGSLYLSRLIDGYDGSYIKAIAAYNAGPGRVRQWMRQFGQPGNTPEEAVNWIEKIPFAETRNYVQRVIENLQIYRHLLNDKGTPSLRIREDITR